MKIEQRIKELGIELPSAAKPGALYVPVKRLGTGLYVSGHIPSQNGEPVYTGKVGAERSLEYAQEAARLCVINILATLKSYTGNLDRIKGVVKLLAFVSSEAGFAHQHLVINAASQLLIDIFGEEEGAHARSAIGTNQLPLDVTVEIEGIFELREL
ncbi:RidA family protein [Paenibacillus senegalensis]|uniref:RidA family protein n=1 Tax=Paenibacillus senegalensis TaxID=1465766 RepID=UPI0002888CC9|nr:RidA family protein [Paenibacillus senegalensis]